MNINFFNLTAYNYHLFLPEIFLFFASTLFIAYFAIFSFARKTFILYSALLIVALVFVGFYSQSGGQGIFFSLVETNQFIHWWKLVFTSLFFFSIVFIFYATSSDVRFGYEYFFLIICYGLAGLIFLGSADLVTFYMAAELQSFCAYILVAYHRVTTNSIESGLKYFVLGSIASSFILFGSALLYFSTGSTNFESMSHFLYFTQENFAGYYLPIIGSWLFISGILFKVSSFPFHFWAPDVYQGTSYAVIFLLSVLSKLVGFVLIIRTIYGIFFEISGSVQFLVYTAGLGSFILGTFLSLRPESLKRFLAYSSMSHVGFILLSLSTYTLSGLYSALFYLLVYLGLTALLVGSILLNSTRKGGMPTVFNQLLEFPLTSPIHTLSLGLVILSMAGIPPFLGFIPKFQVFSSLVESGFVTTALVLMVLSTVGAFYYFRIIFNLVYDSAASQTLQTLYRVGHESKPRFLVFFATSIFFNILYFTVYDTVGNHIVESLRHLFYLKNLLFQ